jgi:hypothetical protein
MGTGRWRFSPFTFDWDQGVLLHDAGPVRLRP